jgi:hypothetical protein
MAYINRLTGDVWVSAGTPCQWEIRNASSGGSWPGYPTAGMVLSTGTAWLSSLPYASITGWLYDNAGVPGWQSAIPYSALSGTPTIPTSGNWPNAGSCTANWFAYSFANGAGPTCEQVNYSMLAGTVPNAPTATALAASPANCSAASAPTGINASGTAQGCTAYTQTIASGTAAMGATAIASGACATVVTATATGAATTDTIAAGFNGDPTAVAGYGASSTGAVLTIYPYPTSGNVNFKVCNSTSASITPGALTLNWKVYR